MPCPLYVHIFRHKAENKDPLTSIHSDFKSVTLSLSQLESWSRTFQIGYFVSNPLTSSKTEWERFLLCASVNNRV